MKRAIESGASPDGVIDAVLCSYPCAGSRGRRRDRRDPRHEAPGIWRPGGSAQDVSAEDAGPAAGVDARPERPPEPAGDAGPPLPRWVPVADLRELPPGGALRVFAGLLDIALFNVNGAIHAIDNRCPHRAGPLVNGHVLGKVVTCPLHAWKFHLETGDSVDHPGARVRTHAVRITDGEKIEVLLPA